MFPLVAAKKVAPEPETGSFEAAVLATRAPKLKEGAERIAASLAKSLQKMAGAATTVEATLAEMSMSYVQKIVAGHLPSAAIAMINCPAVGGGLLVSLDAMLVYTIVDLLCGGNGKETPTDRTRAVTSIDGKFAHIVFTLLAAAIESEWAEFGYGPSTVGKIERLTADVLGPRMQEVGCADVRIKAFGREGTMRLALPPAALDRFAADVGMGAAPKIAPDRVWSSQLQTELQQAPVQLDAYLDARIHDLQSLAHLEIGQVIVLPKESRSHASLSAQGRVLFRGEIGQADDRYSLRIDEVVADAQRTAHPPRFQTSGLFRS